MTKRWEITCGDALTELAKMPAGLVDCVVTSPPYWGLRDYGISGQVGLEASPVLYVRSMVRIFRAIRRVLKRDGTLWLNLGDSYCAAIRGSASPETSTLTNPTRQTAICGAPIDKRACTRRTPLTKDSPHSDFVHAPHRRRINGLKPKDLVGIPWRVAFALQASGWWLRSDIVWAKPNPMPESMLDRPTKSHEYLFLLAKSERYFYDADSIREPHTYNGGLGSHARNDTAPLPSMKPGAAPHKGLHKSTVRVPSGWDTATDSDHRGLVGRYAKHGPNSREVVDRVPRRRKGRGVERSLGRAPEPGEVGAFHPLGRNKRSVWTIATSPFAGAHFATFPIALVQPCIRAGCRPGGLVLDPFSGSGTVGVVALAEGCRFRGIDINPAYVEMASRRLREVTPGLGFTGSA